MRWRNTLAVAAIAIIAVAAWRTLDARSRALAMVAEHEHAVALAGAIRDVAREAPSFASSAEGVLPLVRTAAGEAGIPDSAVREIVGEGAPGGGDAAGGSAGRSAPPPSGGRVTLSGITPGQAGKFIAAIDQRSVGWRIVSIRMVHRPAALRDGTEGIFDVTVTLGPAGEGLP